MGDSIGLRAPFVLLCLQSTQCSVQYIEINKMLFFFQSSLLKKQLPLQFKSFYRQNTS